jgi:hypothetical protein
LSASASWGGVRLLAGCAAINLALAAIGWLWQGGYVAPALLDKVSRSGALTLGSWNWNAVHVVLWALWLSGWFAFLAARLQVARLNGPNLHRLAMLVSAAGSAASLFWLGSLIEVAQRLWALDAGRLLSTGVSAGLVRWTAAPLAVGAAVAIFYFVILLRSRPTTEDVESTEMAADEGFSPERAGDDSPPDPEGSSYAASQARSERSADDSPAGSAEIDGSQRTDSGGLRPSHAQNESFDADDFPRTKRQAKTRPSEPSAVRTLQFGTAALSLADFGLFWQFVAYGPAETAWSLDRLFWGPAAGGWAALTFLVLAHGAHIVSGALTLFDRPNARRSASNASED